MAEVTVINRGMLQRKVTERVCAYGNNKNPEEDSNADNS